MDLTNASDGCMLVVTMMKESEKIALCEVFLGLSFGTTTYISVSL